MERKRHGVLIPSSTIAFNPLLSQIRGFGILSNKKDNITNTC